MRVVVLLAVMTTLALPTPGLSEPPGEKDIIRAFLESPEIIRAQEELKNNAEPGETKILLYDSMCGVAGCQSSALVAQKYERRKVNPFTTHILGRVYIGTKGDIVRVERVGLIPFKDLVDTKDSMREH
ncbi:MAG: hypothetical protein JSW58_17120 [Candidatus Latescibacterota bacterium]|nr:MAG: hypothetical protein JSW58_17120 [Candidatus Latescibacterota bacterium]